MTFGLPPLKAQIKSYTNFKIVKYTNLGTFFPIHTLLLEFCVKIRDPRLSDMWK